MKTFSALDRLSKCSTSESLPQVRSETSYATAGHVKHQFLSDCSLVGREKALERTPEEFREDCEAINVPALPAGLPEAYLSEVGLAWNWRTDTARELFRGRSDRAYDVSADEIPGTLDVVGVTDEAVVVYDYKTGWRHLGAAKDSLQLRAGAVAAARAYGRKKAIIGFIRLVDDEPVYVTDDLMETELDEAAYELAQLARALEELKQPPPLEGEHCRYCPAFASCPAKVTLALNLGREAASAPAPTTLPLELTAENFPAVLARLEAAEELLKRVRSAVEDFARQTPVALPDGMTFGAVEASRETIDALKAEIWLAAEFGPKVATDAVETTVKVTKTNLQRALKLHVKGTPVTKLMERAMAGLRKADAVHSKNFVTVKRFKRRLSA